MNGILDQITALRWLQAHLPTLGGDPRRVTIGGCSAGGLSVCSLTASPLSRGLFEQSAIAAGACNGPWGPGGVRYGYEVARRFEKAVGQDAVAHGGLWCMKTLPPEKF